ncbi:unnamed protein product [Cylindrotheca closterium]|uniref:Uncharacterized protein n=1 Tax=Cylindrotheca closterium TaxID=2856 RepID=A0AAD2PVM8_9STRA|nr:unnamed protein product [Cylindrotheca closterium]
MNKSDAQSSSYVKAKLSPTDVQYCALDAVVSLWVCHRALASLAQGGQLVDPHPTLQVGKRCIVTHNTKDIAAGTLRFVGTRGEQRSWNRKTLGRADCMVAIESPIDEAFEPKRRHSSWPQTAKTLGELKRSLHTFELTVKVNQIKILLDDYQPSCTPAMVGDATVQPFQVDKSYLDGLLQEHQASNNSTPMVPMQVDIIGQEDDTEDRAAAGLEAEIHKDSETGLLLTKSVRDLFHQFHNIPLSEKADEAEHVCQFLLAETWINDEHDYANVVKVVLSKGETDLASHEFFQREYWRKQVRRNTPLPKDHANNIRAVQYEIWTNRAFERIRTKPLEQWFEEFVANAENGLYYIPPDMKFYRVDRIDADGLKIYLTDFGTNLNESLHQKYADLVGTFAVGVETADILLVLRSFRFNIAAGIARCGEPDFCTDRHDIVDKTQHWLMHILPH